MAKDVESKKPKKMALGKGLNSLLGLNVVVSDEEGGGAETLQNLGSNPNQTAVVQLRPESIDPNPHQPRKNFDQKEIEALSKSLKVDGVLQPIIVTKNPETPGRFILIAGERRWRASQLAGLDKIPVIVKEVDTNDRLRLALIENIQRQDLNALEEGLAYRQLIEEFGYTQEQLATKVGKDRATIANLMRLLALPKQVQKDIVEKKLTMGHGRALLSIGEKAKIIEARDMVLKKDLNVRQTEQLCRKYKKDEAGDAPAGASSQSKDPGADMDYLMEHLRSHLRTKVKFVGSQSRGKIEISYFSAVELERILNLIGGKE